MAAWMAARSGRVAVSLVMGVLQIRLGTSASTDPAPPGKESLGAAGPAARVRFLCGRGLVFMGRTGNPWR
jgi:hypothetical protein